jgi:hypothetical protein
VVRTGALSVPQCGDEPCGSLETMMRIAVETVMVPKTNALKYNDNPIVRSKFYWLPQREIYYPASVLTTAA